MQLEYVEEKKQENILAVIKNRGNLPRHIAIIMDGNGRWARVRGKPRIFGHRAGIEAVRDVVEASAELGLQTLTLYAFSKENWTRPKHEIDALMILLKKYLEIEKKELRQNGIRLNAIGRIHELEKSAQRALKSVIDYTAGGDGMVLNLALSYSGRSEIVDTVRTITKKVMNGEIGPEDIDESLIKSCLYTGKLSDPDLLIRTSGEFRISNFLLWQLAYTEIYVTEVLWPDFRREDLYQAIENFQRRERRFGGVKED